MTLAREAAPGGFEETKLEYIDRQLSVNKITSVLIRQIKMQNINVLLPSSDSMKLQRQNTVYAWPLAMTRSRKGGRLLLF